MKRVIFLVPKNLTFAQLTTVQQQAIYAVFGQYVMPVPDTIAVDGTILVDALVSDDFNPDKMIALGLDWEIVSLWQWDGVGSQTELMVADLTVLTTRQLPMADNYNEYGDVISTRPAKLSEFHCWSGWPEITVN